MKLGEQLRQARLEAGLSQRQLCGDVIPRNMLSQIENGSANPSMATLQHLAARLGKPVSYFLQEQTAVSANIPVMTQARQAYGMRRYDQVLEQLQTYEAPDPLFDEEKRYLHALAAIARAEQVLQQDPALAEQLLESVEHSTIYYTEAMEQRRRLLLRRSWYLLEDHYRQQENFQQAYAYACKLRNP